MSVIFKQLNFIFWPTILHVYICVTNERKKLFSEFMNLLFDPYCSLRLLIPVFVCTFSWIQTVSVSFTVSSIPISKSTVFIHSQMYKIDIFFEWCERNLITFLRFYDLIRWNDWWIISLCYVLPRCESERCIIAVCKKLNLIPWTFGFSIHRTKIHISPSCALTTLRLNYGIQNRE